MEDTLAEYNNQNNPAMSTTEIQAVAASEPLYQPELREQATQDPEYQQLLSIILNGFPSQKITTP